MHFGVTEFKSPQVVENILPRTMEIEIKEIEDGKLTKPAEMQKTR